MAAQFPMGRLVTTRTVANEVSQLEIFQCLGRHGKKDWGDVDDQDRKTNDWAVEKGGRILSSYNISDDRTLWVITEADRSATTVLFPEDY